jgi:hypothetical protein
MDCPHKTMYKILVVRFGKYSIFGFRFGPLVDIKIEVSYRDCGKFVATIIEGPYLKNFEKIFKDKIELAQQEMIKELTFLIRRKNIIKDAQDKKHREQQVKKEAPKLTTASFDELTTRMRKRQADLAPHDCLMDSKDVLLSKEEEMVYDSYFGDTAKIINRRTKQ